MTDHDVAPDRPEIVASTTIWNSMGVLDAILAFGVLYAVMRAVKALTRFVGFGQRSVQ